MNFVQNELLRQRYFLMAMIADQKNCQPTKISEDALREAWACNYALAKELGFEMPSFDQMIIDATANQQQINELKSLYEK